MLYLLSAFGVLGCAATPPGSDAPPGGGDARSLDATLTVSEAVGTAGVVTYATPTPGEGVVEVQEPGGPVRRFPAVVDAAGGATVALAGLAADTDYTWQVVATDASGEVYRSEPAVFSTAPPPFWLPRVTTVVEGDPWAPGFTLTTFIGEKQAAAVIDRQGRFVWWYQAPEGQMPCQVRLESDGTLSSLDVDAMFTNDVGSIVRIGTDGVVRTQARAPLAHHDFVTLPDGRVGYLAFDIREWEGMDVVGDALVVLDPATGLTETVWSTWDSLLPDGPAFDSIYPFGRDWTHANNLLWDDAAGEWVVSLHNLGLLVRIDAAGEVVWMLGGGPLGDFELVAGTPFARQHSPVLTDAGVLLFDNGEPDPDALYSRAVEYRLDTEARQYEEIWSFSGDGHLYTAFMGGVERTTAGTTIIGWGSAGRITEVDAAGTVVWQIETEVGSSFGFTHSIETLGEVSE